jgi:hypothetical protein
MTMDEMKPTPNPAISRPATMTPSPVEAVSRIPPTMKIPHPMMIVIRRPIKSAISPAMIAPKKVLYPVSELSSQYCLDFTYPAERIDVTRDCCDGATTNVELR